MIKLLAATTLGLAIGMLFGIAVAQLGTTAPRLVGHDCYQTSGPIYANGEDHFPPCRSIERN